MGAALGGDCCGAGPSKMLGGMKAYHRASARPVLPNRTGQTPERVYDIDPTPIGEGGFATVHRVFRKTVGTECAMKTIAKELIPSELALKNEINVQTDLDHPNIVRLLDVFEDHKNIYLVMQMCRGGELFDCITESGAFAEPEAREIFKQVMLAVCYMHSKSIAHRDLKPDNFLVVEDEGPLASRHVKLADFGLSQAFVPGRWSLKTQCGTSYYMAPEVLKGPYDEKCDIWSAGVILHLFLSGSPPFTGESNAEILEQAATGKLCLQTEVWQGVSPNAKLLVVQMCKLNFERRPTAQQVLESPWLQQAGGLEEEEDYLLHSCHIVDRLKEFSGLCQFQQTALYLVARHLPEHSVKKQRKSFQDMDADGSGSITLDELRKSVKGRTDTDESTLQEAFTKTDTDNSGKLDYTEFLASMVPGMKHVAEEAYWGAFRVFDRDGDGRISKQELRDILEASGPFQAKAGHVEAAKILAKVDANGDDHIDFQEFVSFLSPAGAGKCCFPRGVS